MKSVRQINQAANFTLLEWADNSEIAARSPAEYVPKYEAMHKETVALMYADHGLPERWYEMPYDEFLAKRRVRMAQVIRRGFEALAQ